MIIMPVYFFRHFKVTIVDMAGRVDGPIVWAEMIFCKAPFAGAASGINSCLSNPIIPSHGHSSCHNWLETWPSSVL